jgi:sterol 14alpha-demethylase
MDLATLVTQPITLLALAMTLIVAYRLLSPASGTNVPWAKTSIPFLGGAIGYGKHPVNFLVEQRQKVGDVFRINLLVMKMTFVIGSKVSRSGSGSRKSCNVRKHGY